MPRAETRAAAPDRSAHIGARLRAIRQQKRLTLEQVVQGSGLDKSYLSRLERDLTTPSVATLVKVCDALGIRPGELFDPPKTRIVRRDSAPLANFGGEGVTERLLSQGLSGELMVLRTSSTPAGTAANCTPSTPTCLSSPCCAGNWNSWSRTLITFSARATA
ncbi:epoxidase, putative [Deinococcus radiodurans R1 = ATCC 13939 = DSM 20539]|uniref:Epoxidase, putative n=1 Tax=Deinococcus radiodurans (strain ATCC 13939 / DSM 20539 / JCM 16871 / CCUG 27074 / LMG 4051 / NBRC 15346 / NCIMB 9279 / VKM B-1422 / R1) TaxID=243230 RepID=Q9RVJ9_DEIRA|nr:epoxidase, putative [Deinococcus radiodurans R1 = ATCC 13939 = DSM 20539]